MNDFNNFAKNYREIHDNNLKVTGYTSSSLAEKKIRAIAQNTKEIHSNKRLNILDLGCGDGSGVFYFKKYFPQAFICGLDVSEENIKVALNRKIENSEFKTYNGERIPYPDESLDIILLACVLHHVRNIDDKINILKECYRVLNARGTLYIFEHNPYNPITCKIVNECIFDKDAKLISFLEMRRLLRKINFQIKLRFIIFLPEILKNNFPFENLLWWLPLGGQYYCICKKANGKS